MGGPKKKHKHPPIKHTKRKSSFAVTILDPSYSAEQPAQAIRLGCLKRHGFELRVQDLGRFPKHWWVPFWLSLEEGLLCFKMCIHGLPYKGLRCSLKCPCKSTGSKAPPRGVHSCFGLFRNACSIWDPH